MNNFQKHFINNEKPIKYSLIASGIFLILIGIFVEFSWLKTIGDSYAADGDCSTCKILVDLSFIIFLIIGGFIIIFSIKYFHKYAYNRHDLKTNLELAVLFILSLFLLSSQIRYFDNDEYEHLHNAWLMIEGTIPFFSIVVQHTRLLEWFIVLFMNLTGESTVIIQTMRLFMFFTSCASLIMIYMISHELFNSRTKALLSILLVISNYVWITVSTEIRPDNIMLIFALLSFWFLIQYYKYMRMRYIIMFLLCAVLSMLGKQNAAVFYLAVAMIFAYDYIIRRKYLNVKKIIVLSIIVVILSQVDIIREFIAINVQRHLIPNDIKFWPGNLLIMIYHYNPALFILFVLQMVSPIELNKSYEIFSKYLKSISFACFVFLFLMNRPWMQEMLVMVVFMSILSANIFADILGKLNWKVANLIIALLILPALLSTKNAVGNGSFTNDLETTKTILEISDKNDLVFDAYGKAIFRHHPLEPGYLLYFPEKFDRIHKVKSSNVKYLIKDTYYYPRFPKELLKWFDYNFERTDENPNIYKRITYNKG